MAKKAESDSMAEEIRSLLKENCELTGPEVYDALMEKFTGEKIKEDTDSTERCSDGCDYETYPRDPIGQVMRCKVCGQFPPD